MSMTASHSQTGLRLCDTPNPLLNRYRPRCSADGYGLGITFIKKAALAGGLSLGRKRPRSALQQSLAALQYIMYQLVRSRIISTDHRFIGRDSSHDHQS